MALSRNRTPPSVHRRHIAAAAAMASAVAGITACETPRGPGGAQAPPINPACTLLCEAQDQRFAPNGVAFVSERTDAGSDHHFAAFRSMGGVLGNPSVTPRLNAPIDTYGVSEVWQRFPGAPVVWRGEATPAIRKPPDNLPDQFGSAWVIRAQDATGAWSAAIGTGTAHDGLNDLDTPETGGLYVPQLMTVGEANPEVFACAGARTEDRRARTTVLFAVRAPSTAAPGRVDAVQDLLYGDRYFVPIPADALSPAILTPPTPTVGGAGDSTAWGEITECVMRQVGDDVTTRELHMLLVSNGHLHHSVASAWGPATNGIGGTIMRFGAVSPWKDIGVQFGLGPVHSASMVTEPGGLSVFITAASGGGMYRIWHLQRRTDGSWRVPRDVLAASGDAPAGTVYPFQVAAGRCPTFAAGVWDDASTETILALWGGSSRHEVLVIRVGANSASYSPWRAVPTGALTSSFLIRNVRVSARPFADTGAAYP